MNNFQDLLGIQGSEISLAGFVASLFCAALLSEVLAWFYARHGNTISNRRAFAKNFFVITLTTATIITVVKSSLALSLGLVGALSIVRFRTAIKEPEELSYMFMCIAIGLGFGANQYAITFIGFTVLVTGLFLKGKFLQPTHQGNMVLSISSNQGSQVKLDQIVDLLKPNCRAMDMRRFDHTPEGFEASFMVVPHQFSDIGEVKRNLLGLDPNLSLSFVASKALI